MTNVQAALGCAQLERATGLLDERKRIHSLYTKYLDNVPNISLNKTYEGYTNSFWLVTLEVDNMNEVSREKFMGLLKEKGIDSRPFFYPMSAMPYFDKADNPATYSAYQKGLNLPTYVGLLEADIEYIAQEIKNALKHI